MTMQDTGRRPDPPFASEARSGPPAGAVSRRRLTPSQAVVQRPFLVALPVIVLLVPALAWAMLRPPTYTAEARMLVGGFNVEAQAVPGFVAASQTLAETYSRLVSTRTIEERVAQILQVDVASVDGHIDATSVPESAIIRITGTDDEEETAVQFAAAAAQALQDYASTSGRGEDAEALLDQYRAARVELNQATARRDALRGQYDARVAAGSATDADLAALSEAEADVDRAQLKADTLAGAYGDVEASAGGAGTPSVIAPASSGGDDRSRNLQLAIAAPLLLGSVAGVALATLVANRRGTPAHAALP